MDENRSAVLEMFCSHLSFSGLDEDSICVGVARVGSDTQTICSSTLKNIQSCDLGGPLHSLVIAGHMHPLELDMLKLFTSDENVTDRLNKLYTWSSVPILSKEFQKTWSVYS